MVSYLIVVALADVPNIYLAIRLARPRALQSSEKLLGRTLIIIIDYYRRFHRLNCIDRGTYWNAMAGSVTRPEPNRTNLGSFGKARSNNGLDDDGIVVRKPKESVERDWSSRTEEAYRFHASALCCDYCG